MLTRFLFLKDIEAGLYACCLFGNCFRGKDGKRRRRLSFIFTCLHNLLSYHIKAAVRCTLVPRSKIENPESLFFMRQKTDFLTQILQFCVTDPTGGSNVDENTSSDNGDATVVTVEGGRADLPCDIEAKSADDSVYLVLWYRKNSGTPIYRFVP